MLIQRNRNSENGAVHAATWGSIKDMEDRAQLTYIDYVRRAGEVRGENYSSRLVSAHQVDEDLRDYVGNSDELYVCERALDYAATTTVYDLAAGRGVQRQIPLDGGETEYYELEESFMRHLGSSLIGEIFKPGSNPELSELAEASKSSLVDPDELPARIMTGEEYKRATATARLSQFTLSHLVQVVGLYRNIAYADSTYQPRRLGDDEMEELHQGLLQSESAGLRTGTKYLDCAKHELRVVSYEDILNTSMYLNYDIQVGPERLHFRDDIDMAVEYGEQARSYFDAQGIAAVRPRL